MCISLDSWARNVEWRDRYSSLPMNLNADTAKNHHKVPSSSIYRELTVLRYIEHTAMRGYILYVRMQETHINLANAFPASQLARTPTATEKHSLRFPNGESTLTNTEVNQSNDKSKDAWMWGSEYNNGEMVRGHSSMSWKCSLSSLRRDVSPFVSVALIGIKKRDLVKAEWEQMTWEIKGKKFEYSNHDSNEGKSLRKKKVKKKWTRMTRGENFLITRAWPPFTQTEHQNTKNNNLYMMINTRYLDATRKTLNNSLMHILRCRDHSL